VWLIRDQVADALAGHEALVVLRVGCISAAQAMESAGALLTFDRPDLPTLRLPSALQFLGPVDLWPLVTRIGRPTDAVEKAIEPTRVEAERVEGRADSFHLAQEFGEGLLLPFAINDVV